MMENKIRKPFCYTLPISTEDSIRTEETMQGLRKGADSVRLFGGILAVAIVIVGIILNIVSVNNAAQLTGTDFSFGSFLIGLLITLVVAAAVYGVARRQ